MRYKVSVKNKVLGDSERIMTLFEMSDYNKCVYACALKLERDSILYNRSNHIETMGMWTVEMIE